MKLNTILLISIVIVLFIIIIVLNLYKPVIKNISKLFKKEKKKTKIAFISDFNSSGFINENIDEDTNIQKIV